MLRVNVIKKIITAEGHLDLNVDLCADKGDFITLYGSSGTGKTTILRMIAGLTTPDSGFISMNDEVWFDSSKGINLPARQRRTGFVFQEYSLFPHMTVRENLVYALEHKNKTHLIDAFLDVVSLKELQFRKPDELSGGQKQRVALIRALLREPLIYLLDEPLAALDVEMRSRLQDEIVRLYRKANITTIFVSHDISEVFKLSGKVCVLRDGRITQTGSAEKIFAGNHVSGKFKFAGEIVEIKQDQGLYILTILIGNNPVKVVATSQEMNGLSIGSNIIIASKAFNPIILKNS